MSYTVVRESQKTLTTLVQTDYNHQGKEEEKNAAAYLFKEV